MANHPIDDFDPRNPKDEAATHDEPQELIDDEADFGGSHSRRAKSDLHDDADFVDDDMNDIVDDADPLADGDDTGYDEHDHDDSDAEEDRGEMAEAAEAEMSRSRTGIGSLIFYIIIAGVIAGGGYMAYRTFTTGGDPVSPGTVLQAANTAASDVKSVVVPTDANAPTPAPLPANNSNPVPNSGPTADSNNRWQTTLPDDLVTPTPQAQPAAAPVATTTATANPMPVAVPTTANGAAAAPLAATVANTEAMAGLNARLAETESQLTQMQQSLQASQAEVVSLKKQQTQAAVVTAPPVVNDGELTAMRAENASLQKKIDQLTRAQQSLQAQLQSANAHSAVAPMAMAAASPKGSSPKATPKAKVSKPAEDSMMMADDNTPRSPKTRAPTASKSNWVLRAATPGMAWVSPQPGSAELKRVVPGDSLPGIGQVTAIRQENGRWIVEGSGGVIR